MSIPLILDGKFFKIGGEDLEKIKLSSNANLKIKAVCMMCKSKESEISGNLKSTSNFTTHLKRVHPEVVEQFEKYKKDNKTSGKNLTVKRSENDKCLKQIKLASEFFTQKIDKQQKFNKNVMNYVINSMKPLSTVEDLNFIKHVKDLDENIDIMSRRTLGRKISERNQIVRTNLKAIIKSIPFVSTTADIWSTKYRSYMGVTVHWIEPKTLDRVSAVLACKRFAGVHSYDRIAELLLEITSEFDLNHQKIVSTVTDNGSNFVKAFNEFGCSNENEISVIPNDNDFETDDELPLAELYAISTETDHTNLSNSTSDVESESPIILPHHLRCASHTLSLLATTDFIKILKNKNNVSKIHYPAIAKCTSMWNAARRPKTAEIIRAAIENQLLFPTPTRWNSLFDAIQHLLKYKEKLNHLLNTIGIQSSFKPVELEYLEEYILIFKPIAIALDSLQGQHHCYYGQLYPTLFSLKIRLEKLRSENLLRYCNPIVIEITKSLQVRFKSFFEFAPEANHALIATCLHPIFKMRWLPDPDKTTKLKIQMLCINALEKIKSCPEQNGSLSSSGEEEEQDDGDERFYVFDSNPNPQISNKSNLELEFINYVGDKSKLFSNLNNYPTIKKAFAKYNTSLCSSAPVERLFSLAGFINTPARGSLSDGIFEKLVFLKGNQDLCK